MNVNYCSPDLYHLTALLPPEQENDLLVLKRIPGCIEVHLNNTEKTLKLFGLKLTKLGRNNIL